MATHYKLCRYKSVYAADTLSSQSKRFLNDVLCMRALQQCCNGYKSHFSQKYILFLNQMFYVGFSVSRNLSVTVERKLSEMKKN